MHRKVRCPTSMGRRPPAFRASKILCIPKETSNCHQPLQTELGHHTPSGFMAFASAPKVASSSTELDFAISTTLELMAASAAPNSLPSALETVADQ